MNEQSFANHAKMVPLYHYVAFSLVAIPALWFLVQMVRAPSLGTAMTALFGVGVVLSTYYARAFPLGVQDRVIRLEERIRLERLLPGELRPRITELSTDALVGLRFASDEELAELTRRVLAGELDGRRSIKGAVRSWRADHQRI